MKKFAFNPYLPQGEYVPDGEPHVFGDRVYVYGSHDQFGANNFCVLDYVGYSAPVDDLSNWRYEGVIYRKTQDPDNADGSHVLFAPDVCQGPDGKFYLFYGLDFTKVIGVARADSPAGPFEFYGKIRDKEGRLVGLREGDAMQYDPGVLVDDDGSVYLYSGFCTRKGPWLRMNLPVPTIQGAMVMKLEPDMLTIAHETKTVLPWSETAAGTSFEGHAFFEASSMRKRGDTYYYIYSSENGHELCYAKSDKPDGGFVYGGTIISNGDIFPGEGGNKEPLNYTGTNHGSIEEINGKWYVFYHRQTNKNYYTRQGCAEEIAFDKDGNIPQVQITSFGLNGGPLPASETCPAYVACNLMSGEGALMLSFGMQVPDNHPFFTQESPSGEPVQYIANMQGGAVAGFKYLSFTGSEQCLAITYRSADGATLKVGTTLRGAQIGCVKLEPAEDWTETVAKVTAPEGAHAVYLTVSEGKADLLKFRFQ
ncbi:MAG: family 43 glycosylhydrolase [Firmicutes bacterium]|nr:family 43 glycosylhydrolase [Bacillota bacterium]